VTVPAVQTRTETRPLALFVLGMHRSGSSLLTRVLSLCGGTLPSGLIGADPGNPLGHWEPRAAMDLNDAILHRHGSGVYDPSLRMLDEGAFDAEDAAACINKIKAFLHTLPTAPLVIIKEPRITLFSSLWIEAARRAGLEVAAVIAVRHPQEVIASLGVRDRVSPELGSALWLKYSLLAERQTRTLPRVFIDYANLLGDWRGEINRISTSFAVDLNARDESAIEDFLIPDLRRQRCLGPVINVFGTNWISTVYETLYAAARDEPSDFCSLDRVFTEYQTSEHDFRMAFDNFHDRFNGLIFRNVFRPSVTKRMRAAGSLATRLGVTSYWLRHHRKETSRYSKFSSRQVPPKALNE
jgi:hypothetical protein